jgi:hypothetical protein
MPSLDTGTKCNNNIEKEQAKNLVIVDIDDQLSVLRQKAPAYLHAIIDKIRNDFFKLSYFNVGCDIENFANHKPGDCTPVDCFWSNKQQEDTGGCT